MPVTNTEREQPEITPKGRSKGRFTGVAGGDHLEGPTLILQPETKNIDILDTKPKKKKTTPAKGLWPGKEPGHR